MTGIVPVPYSRPGVDYKPNGAEILVRLYDCTYAKCLDCKGLVDLTTKMSMQIGHGRYEGPISAMFVTKDEEHFLCPTCTVENFPEGHLKNWTWNSVKLEVLQALVGEEDGKEFFRAIHNEPDQNRKW